MYHIKRLREGKGESKRDRERMRENLTTVFKLNISLRYVKVINNGTYTHIS